MRGLAAIEARVMDQCEVIDETGKLMTLVGLKASVIDRSMLGVGEIQRLHWPVDRLIHQNGDIAGKRRHPDTRQLESLALRTRQEDDHCLWQAVHRNPPLLD